jgi:hypothetical protein
MAPMLRVRRALRHVFTILSLLSLLLCVAVCALWVRSRSHIDVARHAGPLDAALTQTRSQFYSCEGVICLSHVRSEQSTGPVTETMAGGFRTYPTSGPVTDRPFSGFGPAHYRPLGFGVVRRVTTDPSFGPWQRRWTHLALSVPHWFVALLLVAAPAWWSRARLTRGFRRRAGGCLTCGYDLRAHGAGERCPECGTVAKPSA